MIRLILLNRSSKKWSQQVPTFKKWSREGNKLLRLLNLEERISIQECLEKWKKKRMNKLKKHLKRI